MRNYLGVLCSRFLVLVAGLVVFQFVTWKDFAPRVTWLQTKAVLFGLGADDLRDFGAICNTLEDYACSADKFAELTQVRPQNPGAYANLAIALSRLNQHDRSLDFYRRYLQLGGSSPSTLFEFAESLRHSFELDRATFWYYQSLYLNPSLNDSASALVDLLVERQRHQEALSVIGSLTAGHPEKDLFWQAKYRAINMDLLNRNGGTQLASNGQIRLPALDGQNHYVPVQLGETGSGLQLFLFGEGEKAIIVRKDMLREGEYQKSSHERLDIEAEPILIRELQVGPWSFKNVRAFMCSDCTPSLGQLAMKQFEVYEEPEQKLAFLRLAKAQ